MARPARRRPVSGKRPRGPAADRPGPPQAGSPPPANAPRSQPTGLPLRKKLLFSAIVTVGLLAVLELALAVLGIRTAASGRDPYAGFTPRIPHFETVTEPDGTRMVRVAENRAEVLNPVSFPETKPAGSYRIVCLGGSTTYGRPFFDHTAFPGWLRAFLPAADPSRDWEVINAGAISYASYRVRGLMEELSRFEPDLFVVYMGHNEFLERRTYADVLATPGWLRGAGGLIHQTRTATVIQQGLDRVGLLGPPDPTHRAAGLQDEVTRIPINAVGPEAYTRDPAFHAEVLAHFEATLQAMVDLAESRGAGLILVTTPSNLRDFAPIKSEHRAGLGPEQLRDWQTHFDAGTAALAAGDSEAAREAFARAEAIDDQHAELLYRSGQALDALGQTEAARDRFLRAREEDICSLRALSATNEAIRRVAAARGVPLVDAEALLTARSPDQIPGEEAFFDHVHLKVEPHRRLALDLLEAMATAGVVQPVEDWGEATIAAVTATVEAGIDGPRYARELYALSGLLEYLGQPEQALKRVLEGLDLSGDDPEGWSLAGRYRAAMGRPEEAAASFRRALALDPASIPAHEGLGALLLDTGNPEAALVHLEAVWKRAPNAVANLNRIGVAYSRLGRLVEATDWFARAIQLNGNDPAILSNLGRAEELLGRREAAREHYRTALRIDPNHPEAQAGRRRLASSP
ncbi:tetratricopeptide repeat protein [Tautonia marina]|uniref:tetratricopeptide repeat protein n=1 Tax=Tautonia marina TaxID=2653855 RepID=UPI001375518B|nr:tetratricopeptide repeat protein [Tautonia marina]